MTCSVLALKEEVLCALTNLRYRQSSASCGRSDDIPPQLFASD